MVRQSIDAQNPDAVTVANYYDRLPFRSSLDPSNKEAVCITNPYGVKPRKALEQGHLSRREGQTGYPKQLGNEGTTTRRLGKKFRRFESD